MTQKEMNRLVPETLFGLENDLDMKVLLAVESGSRAWGFASPDSDFDVRFIYVRKPAFYLNLEEKRDVIEMPVDETWDVAGWDLDKTLKLLFKSNPTLYEWLGSPVRYVETGFTERFAPLAADCFSQKRMLFHYLNTAKNNVKAYLSGEKVIPKKYFYALRPVLACRWVLDERSAPPVPFSALTDTELPEFLKEDVARLLELKMNAPEKTLIPRMTALDRYLSDSIAEIEEIMNGLPEDGCRDWTPLNDFFRHELGLD